jgi:hypothetical protein
MNTFAMYKALLSQQWKHQRVEITALAIAAAVACPGALWMNTSYVAEYRPWDLLNTAAKIAVIGASASLLAGLLLSVRPFVLDARVRHTYALGLPIQRSHYALLRAASGLTLVLVPTAAFLIGAVLAAATAPPTGLIRAFPVQLTLRFLLASAFAFSVGFGAQYGLGRRLMRWCIIVGLTLILCEALGQMMFHVSLTEPFWALVWHDGSPMHVFLSEWTLFNV